MRANKLWTTKAIYALPVISVPVPIAVARNKGLKDGRVVDGATVVIGESVTTRSTQDLLKEIDDELDVAVDMFRQSCRGTP